jgi:hypothetical protein
LLRTLADDLLREAWADEDLRILVGDSAAAD